MIDFIFISNLKIDILINVLINVLINQYYYCFLLLIPVGYQATVSVCTTLKKYFYNWTFCLQKLKCYVAMET